MRLPVPENGARRETQFEREPSRRVFAAELREIASSSGTGQMKRARLMSSCRQGNMQQDFLVGTLTEKKRQGEQNMFYRARIVDPTGTFFVMAGSYQPEAMQQMARIEPPAFVAVVGKPTLYTKHRMVISSVSVRAESVTIVEPGNKGLLGPRHGKSHPGPA